LLNDNYLHLGVACCLHYQGPNSLLGLLKNLKVEAASFLKMSGSIYQFGVSYPRRL